MINSSDKKKMLYVVESLGGGVFTYIVSLLNVLCEEYEVYLAYATRPQTPSNLCDYFDDRIKLIEVKDFTRALNPVKDFKAFFELRRIADRVKPNIIHLHSSKAGALGRWAFSGKKYSMFYTPHGYSFLMQNDRNIKRSLYKLIEFVSGKRYCTTIACSKGEYQEALKITRNVTYINNGIDIGKIERTIKKCHETKSKRINDQFTVFTLGRICHQKNPELFNNIAEKFPDVKFLWIGDGELREKLSSPNIIITGWVDRNNAFEYSINADVFLMTSLWEGLPISLLEAMYMKKLCIVSNVIGNRDVIENGVNGFVCNNENEFIKTINYAINNDVSDLVGRAYEDILKEYNTDIMSEKYKSVYKSCS